MKKVVVGSLLTAGGIGMYLLLKKFFGNDKDRKLSFEEIEESKKGDFWASQKEQAKKCRALGNLAKIWFQTINYSTNTPIYEIIREKRPLLAQSLRLWIEEFMPNLESKKAIEGFIEFLDSKHELNYKNGLYSERCEPFIEVCYKLEVFIYAREKNVSVEEKSEDFVAAYEEFQSVIDKEERYREFEKKEMERYPSRFRYPNSRTYKRLLECKKCGEKDEMIVSTLPMWICTPLPPLYIYQTKECPKCGTMMTNIKEILISEGTFGLQFNKGKNNNEESDKEEPKP